LTFSEGPGNPPLLPRALTRFQLGRSVCFFLCLSSLSPLRPGPPPPTALAFDGVFLRFHKLVGIDVSGSDPPPHRPQVGSPPCCPYSSPHDIRDEGGSFSESLMMSVRILFCLPLLVSFLLCLATWLVPFFFPPFDLPSFSSSNSSLRSTFSLPP